MDESSAVLLQPGVYSKPRLAAVQDVKFIGAVDRRQPHVNRSCFGGKPPTRVWTWREKSNLDLIVVAAPEDKPITKEESRPEDKGTEDKRACKEHADQEVEGEPPAPLIGACALQPGSKVKEQAPGASSTDLGCFAVVLEVKIKALPTAKQLLGYSEKLAALDNLDLSEPRDIAVVGKGKRRWGRISLQVDKDAPEASLMPSTVLAYAPAAQDGESRKRGDDVGGHAFCWGRGTLRRVLLAPRDPARAAHNAAWALLTVDDLVATFPTNETEGKGLVAQILSDYRTSTQALVRILEIVYAEVEQEYCAAGSGTTLLSLYRAITHRDFKAQRIHDVVGKYAYSVIELRLRDALKGSEHRPRDDLADGFGTETFMTNATPGLNLEYATSLGEKVGSVRIGVQIQGKKYRHFISVSHPNDDSGALAKLLDDIASRYNGWDFRLRQDAEAVEAREGSFGEDSFRYLEMSAADLTFSDLVKQVKASLAVALAARASSLWNEFAALQSATLAAKQALKKTGRARKVKKAEQTATK